VRERDFSFIWRTIYQAQAMPEIKGTWHLACFAQNDMIRPLQLTLKKSMDSGLYRGELDGNAGKQGP
jgi:hypothetical protein